MIWSDDIQSGSEHKDDTALQETAITYEEKNN